MEISDVKSVERLSYSPDDIIVLKTPEKLAIDHSRSLGLHLQEFIGKGVRVLILDGGQDISILRPASENVYWVLQSAEGSYSIGNQFNTFDPEEAIHFARERDCLQIIKLFGLTDAKAARLPVPKEQIFIVEFAASVHGHLTYLREPGFNDDFHIDDPKKARQFETREEAQQEIDRYGWTEARVTTL